MGNCTIGIFQSQSNATKADQQRFSDEAVEFKKIQPFRGGREPVEIGIRFQREQRERQSTDTQEERPGHAAAYARVSSNW